MLAGTSVRPIANAQLAKYPARYARAKRSSAVQPPDAGMRDERTRSAIGAQTRALKASRVEAATTEFNHSKVTGVEAEPAGEAEIDAAQAASLKASSARTPTSRTCASNTVNAARNPARVVLMHDTGKTFSGGPPIHVQSKGQLGARLALKVPKFE